MECVGQVSPGNYHIGVFGRNTNADLFGPACIAYQNVLKCLPACLAADQKRAEKEEMLHIYKERIFPFVFFILTGG